MKLAEFHVGLQFWCAGQRWKCTDIGSRVVVAICLEPHEIVSVEHDLGDPAGRCETRCLTDDPSWFNGPPFAVAEYVFDEYSLGGCSLTPEEEDD